MAASPPAAPPPGADTIAAPESEVTSPSSEAAAAPPVPTGPAGEALAAFEELRSRGRPLKALHAIRSAARAYPRETAVLRAYVRAAEENKSFGEAHRVAKRWAEFDRSTEARLTWARLERAIGNSPKALSILTAVLKADAGSQEANRLATLWSHDQRLAVNR
jgi:thioredoxin-like negative regulator of GroEL